MASTTRLLDLPLYLLEHVMGLLPWDSALIFRSMHPCQQLVSPSSSLLLPMLVFDADVNVDRLSAVAAIMPHATGLGLQWHPRQKRHIHAHTHIGVYSDGWIRT